MPNQNLHPMENEVNPFAEYVIVQALGIIIGLVVVEGDAGGEHY